MEKRILVVDDDTSFREIMRFNLEEDGFSVTSASDGMEALELFRRDPFSVVVTDLKMPGMSGMELMSTLNKTVPETNTIVITAFSDVETAVTAMKAGAFDFVPKPCGREQFKIIVRRAWEHWHLKNRVKILQSRLHDGDRTIIFRSKQMERVLALAERVAETEATVLISGESGTGKELLARRIHATSARREGTFVAVNCAAIPRDLLESELFGHVRGAFTGAVKDRKGKFTLANGGTIFLDEVAELPLEMQVRLLRVIQERIVDVVGREEPQSVDVRIIAATNSTLEEGVAAGTFREELYFRLNVFPIVIPPLRDRVDDIPVLVNHFIKKYSSDKDFSVSSRLMTRLEAMTWHGNVRELENICQRMILLADTPILDIDLLPYRTEGGPSRVLISPHTIELPPEGASLTDIERDIIIRALEINSYNQSGTAKFLRIPRHVLLYRIEKFKIPLNRD